MESVSAVAGLTLCIRRRERDGRLALFRRRMSCRARGGCGAWFGHWLADIVTH